jgi:hypothetical protein
MSNRKSNVVTCKPASKEHVAKQPLHHHINADGFIEDECEFDAHSEDVAPVTSDAPQEQATETRGQKYEKHETRQQHRGQPQQPRRRWTANDDTKTRFKHLPDAPQTDYRMSYSTVTQAPPPPPRRTEHVDETPVKEVKESTLGDYIVDKDAERQARKNLKKERKSRERDHQKEKLTNVDHSALQPETTQQKRGKHCC